MVQAWRVTGTMYQLVLRMLPWIRGIPHQPAMISHAPTWPAHEHTTHHSCAGCNAMAEGPATTGPPLCWLLQDGVLCL